jgi:DNA-binding NarL/FixJ family response regulator
LVQAEEIRVVVADDHDLFRRGLKDLLEEQGLRVVGEAANGDDAVRLAAHVLPEVVVMDLHMPRVGGVEATRRLAAAAPTVRVLVLTISAEERDVMDAMMAGASGYLLKDASVEEIAGGVRAAAAGESLISPRIASQLLTRLRERAGVQDHPGHADLSDRELEILRLLAQGRDNDEIAEELVISPRTVKNHVSSILTKLQMENRVQAAVYAVRRGLA